MRKLPQAFWVKSKCMLYHKAPTPPRHWAFGGHRSISIKYYGADVQITQTFHGCAVTNLSDNFTNVLMSQRKVLTAG